MLNLASFFHLNLMYSSIAEESRPEVIRRCYHPLLDLAGPGCPISLEATGLTLELIRGLDPGWIERLQAGIAAGTVQFVGSGYSQVIGPLVPGTVNRANLRQGKAAYREILDFVPELWLVNEMAYSGGLPQLLAEVGCRGLVMEWNNTWKGHPEWEPEFRHHHQVAVGCDGTTVPVIWIDTIDFQKFQRLAAGQMELAEWIAHWEARARDAGEQVRFGALYGSDAEVFDFRPRRYSQEGEPGPAGEWSTIGRALEALAARPGLQLTHLGAALDQEPSEVCGRKIRLECTHQPVVVKKQEKYNLNRWALTGRGDVEANTACFARLRELEDPARGAASDEEWRDLLWKWSSDFRTHITAQRWEDLAGRLDLAPPPAPGPLPAEGEELALPPGQRHLELATAHGRAVLDLTRGLALRQLVFPALGPEPVAGTLPHGHFDDIAFGADFFTGHAVVQYPGRRKLTDLQSCAAATRLVRLPDDSLQAGTRVADGEMVVHKSLILRADRPEVQLAGRLELPRRQPGEVHPMHVTIIPGLLGEEGLEFRTHNGGVTEEVFPLAEKPVHHGASYSTLVTAKGGLGATEGTVLVGDGRRFLVVEHDPTVSALIPTLRFEKVRGGQYFLRVRYSAQETDETFVAHDRPWQLAWQVTLRPHLAADPAARESDGDTNER